jgi:hypothetical protein
MRRPPPVSGYEFPYKNYTSRITSVIAQSRATGSRSNDKNWMHQIEGIWEILIETDRQTDTERGGGYWRWRETLKTE